MALLANVIEPWWMAQLVEGVVPIALIWFTWRQYGSRRRGKYDK